jgi:hypothetical protein
VSAPVTVHRGDTLSQIAQEELGDSAEVVARRVDTPELTFDEDHNPVEIQRKYRIKELVGVSSLAKLGADVISSSLEHESFDQRLGALTSKLSEVDWEKWGTEEVRNPWMQSQAGFAGQAELYNVLYRWVYLNERPE